MPRVHKKEERRVSSYVKAVFEVQRSTDIPLCSCCDNTLSNCSTKHMQVHFVLQKELLQAGIPKLDTLFPFLSTLAYADTDNEYFGSSNLNPLAEIQYQNEWINNFKHTIKERMKCIR